MAYLGFEHKWEIDTSMEEMGPGSCSEARRHGGSMCLGSRNAASMKV